MEAARLGWRARLIDTSRRNNLLYFRELKVGTVDFTSADPGAMLEFLQGETVPVKDFLGRGAEGSLATGIKEIRSKALSNFEERGLETLFLAMGMATWRSADGGRPAEAAVLLIPAVLDLRGREGQLFSLARNGPIQVNLALLHVLETDYGVSVSPDELIAHLQGDDEGESYDPEPVYSVLRRAAARVPEFAVSSRMVLGNFAYQKVAMVRDLDEFGEAMAAHELISALAGDPDARKQVQSKRVAADIRELDSLPPEQEFLVLNADSSQQLVVRQALNEQDGVVHGPPGTGKSQTIANLIAEFAANGKKVLFVAEKRAALEVVLARLKDAGLEHLALDLHGADVSRRQLMEQISETLRVLQSAPPVDFEEMHTKFESRRKKLLSYVNLIHREQNPSGQSAFQMSGRILALERTVTSDHRWRGKALQAIDRKKAIAVREVLSELSGFCSLFLRTNPSPWNGARLRTGSDVQSALDLAGRLADDFDELEDVVSALAQESSLPVPGTLDELDIQLDLLLAVRGTLEDYSPDYFSEGTLEDLIPALAPAAGNAVKRAWAFVTNGSFRAAVKRAHAFRTSGKVAAPKLLEEARGALELVESWRRLAKVDQRPRPTPSVQRASEALRNFRRTAKQLAEVVTVPDVNGQPIEAVGDWATALAEDDETPTTIPRLTELEDEIERLGAGEIVNELREYPPAPESLADTFEHAWLSSCMEALTAAHSGLAGFNGRTHDRMASEFRELDEERIAVARARVRRGHAERVIQAMNEHPEQEQVVKREAMRKARFRPFRQLVREAPDVLTSVRPCWMASPLSVSHLLPAVRDLFDVVLFDEASQVLPEDAVPALLRARNAIVAGDRHQLPPTTFFAAVEDDESDLKEEEVTKGFESILDLMSGMLDPWPLDWHYRSRDESLITFSNKHIYGNRLVTFPAPSHDRAITHVLVEAATPRDGEEDSSSDEVRRVVELVIRHAEQRPEESLGVIALGIKHSRRLEGAIDEARKSRPDLDGFFAESRSERFFVKNLERVQGDERDTIILSVGYGKDRAGKLPYRFGPLLYAGGERRLNVAITRARAQMTIVSSFSHVDMDPSRSKARGVELLRLYLEYAASGGTHLSEAATSEFDSNAFERDIADALRDKGIPLLEQWGASRYRIDLVAQHPTEPGRFVLAIECDGATYHSSATARDRDRLRQQHLERLGWRFHRIWSTDWFSRRDSEIERAIGAYEAAVRTADGERQPRGNSTRPKATVPATTVQFSRRPKRPPIPKYPKIDDYSHEQLVTLAGWIMSDERLRTDDELFEAVFEELGFRRRGGKITDAIEAAVREFRGNR